MKKLIVALLTLSTVSAFASSPIETTIRGIEAREGVQCYKVSESRMQFCLGMPSELAVCRYSQTFDCMGESEFKVKLSIKTTPNSSGVRTTKVTKIKYIK